MNLEKIEAARRLLLEGPGVDRSDDNLADTPRRVARVCAEIFFTARHRMACLRRALHRRRRDEGAHRMASRCN
jgi:GTP cyclohydrolase I